MNSQEIEILRDMKYRDLIKELPFIPHQFNSFLTWENKDEYDHFLGSKTIRTKTYVRAMIDWIYANFSGAALPSTPDTSNSAQTEGVNQGWYANSGATITTYGILCGTSSTAVTMADYHMNTLMTNGTGSGQLTYGATSGSGPANTGSEPTLTRYCTLARTMTNGYGSAQTVNEVGIVCESQTGSKFYMVDHTLSTNTINGSGASGTATYTLGITA